MSVRFQVSTLSVPPKVGDPRHREQGEDVGQVLVVKHHDRRPADRDLELFTNGILLAVRHLNDEWNPLADRRLDLVPRHG